ncbi:MULTISPECIES: 2-amino-4-hydroxy-6-hydroxymethyldihydropteridine diphosphokinase [Methylomonas]|uniref:2-amino-4-hydroxy-6-hydroxymethyldihydropteridine pyrophosphokinase n=2 Tax=Methylomonas TaxID=416 RepID=A0A126T3Q5_9GAMM|nr:MULTISPECIES: 2-amino-4-hydroxy-6-hydroxymethyldihydropteridine diphosphokinase [Methylomonas]AMK76698.1 2-amino-4-hydroxy-6-hydroxymethyldihydropteridine pyrophosphokinase [Methylomonas denitrificans]OAI00051.1 2-amino-4-hydroxy-6-hydroxymethyldihydropteridine pyrophosphokinase [Methylomonas methanica]TCV82810.1 2-amino-4-hydroxy-6-hydroxymethyldihydropteridine diphosphokinase [Methylomonas methanica]
MTLPKSGVEAYIGLGSNLEDSVDHVSRARLEIAALPGVAETAFSPLYRSTPVGPQDQPDYVNAVMRISTELEPIALLRQLQQIENQHGRLRSIRWGARTLDLDVLLYAQQIINEPDLIVPHQELSKRAFVLYPLADVASSGLIIPGLDSLPQLLAACPPDGLRKIAA